ncbi:MAG: hypothetical protein J5726_00645 [Treponema sp.]|nr:hypothetical protein [Treponema sp.]
MSSKKNKNTYTRNNKVSVKQNSEIIKIVLIVMVVVSVIIASVTSIKAAVSKRKSDKTVRVAFYGLSQEYCDILKEKIPVEEGITLICEVVSDGAIDLGALKQKYDMIFTWKGEVTDALEDSAEEIPAKITESMPSSLRNKKCAPILLDNCELAYSKEVVEKTGGNMPNSFPAFLNYINDAKAYTFSPFFLNGADDRVLIAFVGNIIEAIGGVDAYKALIQALRSGTPFDQVFDQELTTTGLTLGKVLDSLKDWPGQGYTHPAWYNAQSNDVIYFAEEGHTAVFFTFLHDHRKIAYNIISRYEAFLLPPASSTIEYGIIAPAMSVMLLSENANARRYINEFFTEETQAKLSEQTKLAPVHSRAQAYDRQADDVRYWAASCPGGALSDLYLAAFQRNPAKFTEFAGKLRAMVK